MGLSKRLLDKDLTFKCPHCQATLVRKGSWIKSITWFTCDRCQQNLRLGYGEKLAIFERFREQRQGTN
ncbi:hypothetical protein SAMN03159463_05318 [Mesorhizobium sp. NFR06]|nr:hypothetical protein SAMN03159463_05318 [Mesorhizobium sp. NFR06]